MHTQYNNKKKEFQTNIKRGLGVRERERERERRSSSGSAYVQVAVAVAVHFPFRSPSLPACPATWNWNFPALECSCSVLLLLLLGRLCCTRTSPSSTDKQQAEQHTHTKVEGDVQTKRKEWRKNTLAKGHGIGEWELILFSSFSAAASSSPRLLACVMLCVVLFFLFTLCFRLSTRFWFCVFLCATYAFLSLFRSLLSVRVRRALAATVAATRQQSQRQHNRSLPACLVSLFLSLSFVAKRTPHSMSLSACCVVKRQLNKCMRMCVCIKHASLHMCT